MVVLTHMAAWGKRQFGDPKLVLFVDFAEEARNGRLELNFGNQALVSTFTGLPPVCAAASLVQIADAINGRPARA
jgi:hypothetical protein